MDRGRAVIVLEANGLNWVEHVAVGAGRIMGPPVFHNHERDNVVGVAEVDVTVDLSLSKPNVVRDEVALGKIGVGRPSCQVGVELGDVLDIGQRVASPEGEHGQRGVFQDVMGDGVHTGRGERAPPAGIKNNGLFVGIGVFGKHDEVFFVVGVIFSLG